MEFQENHKFFFNCERGTFSQVTEREYFDSQITLDKDEKKLFVLFFGSSNILHGNASSNPTLATKKFLAYPELKPINLNLLFPKHDKPELRLYISKDNGFKPNGGDIWFAYISKKSELVIGSMAPEQWNAIKSIPDGALYRKPAKKLSQKGKESDKYKIRLHSFEPGAKSIIQMGQELIGHPTTAINELVKNGYDADATSCKVYFHFDDNPNKSFAVISDNGTGMNDKILFGSWLQPSVSPKREGNGKSFLYGRNFLGSKGIGRLAAMALGKSVTVITKQKHEKNYNWITVDRDKFNEKKLLSQIKFPGDKVENAQRIFENDSILNQRNAAKNSMVYDFLLTNQLDSFSQGTLVVIERLDDSVLKILHEDFIAQTEELQYEQFAYKNTEFYKGLATLITPTSLNEQIQEELIKKKIITSVKKNADKKGDFNLELATNLLPEQEEASVDWLPVVPIPVHVVFDYRVYGKVTSEGEVKGVFVYHRIEKDFKEEKFEIAANELRSKSEQLNLFNNISVPKVGEYYFDVRVYDMGESDNVEKLSQEAGFDNKSQFRSAFKSFQGLRVSKNGFGVKPYGEEVEDWIGLSKERLQDPGHNVSTNQLLGYVFFFSPENDALEEKTNREGFLENTAFNQVRNDLRIIFKTLGSIRYNYRVQYNLSKIPQSKHTRPDFQAYIEFVKANENLKEIRKYSEGFIQEVTTAMDNLEESLSFSERLASLGSGIELVYHEMGQPISGLKTTQSSLGLKKEKIEEKTKKNYLYDLEALSQSIEILVALRKSLQPAIGKSRIKTFNPYDTFLKVCGLFKSDINEYQISIKADIRFKDFELKDLEYAFWIGFLNIINNAVYWIKKAGKGREIRFNIKSGNIIISNTGPIIDTTILNTLFEYGVTKKPGGTGLGLAFTRSVLSKIDWDITAANTLEGPIFTLKKIKQ
jgi:signal transduction histidine kinase